MEPWLDSLSEDWKSEHDFSSLSLHHSKPPLSKHGSITSNASQSRIPHLAQNHTKSTTNAKYLRSRSLRGTPPLKGSPILAEQNPSKLNITAQNSTSTTSQSQRKLHATSLPRRASSALSDSAQSVQHYTLPNRSAHGLQGDEMPEWKRRLARGEDIAGEGCDLFGPSRLECIFRAPPNSEDENQPPMSSSFEQPMLWSIPSSSSAMPTFDQFQSMKVSRSKQPGLDMVEEASEGTETTDDGSRSGERVVPHGSLRGFMKQQDGSYELPNSWRSQTPGSQPATASQPGGADLNRLQEDPRIRTTSGQEELKNEWISPITLSKQNTIRDHALQDSLGRSPGILQAKLEQLGLDDSQRPLSPSSDQGVVYGHNRAGRDDSVHDETGADLTSQSLPDDLSMGTQDFISRGGFVNKRRGGFSNDGSFRTKALSVSNASSHQGTSGQPTSSVGQSSPLLPVESSRTLDEAHLEKPTSPMTSPASKQAQHNEQPSFGSPLKLFGNRDTYTNNKLLRVLSHFEDADSGGDSDLQLSEPVNNQVEGDLRMSQFGQGELDQYDFVQEVKLMTLDGAQGDGSDSHIFTRLLPSDPYEDGPSSAARDSPIVRSAVAANQGTFEVQDIEFDQAKRSPNSPLKERTPKRRRTLIQQEIEESRPRQLEDDLVIPRASSSKLAGTKRKDARYDDAAATVDPNSLAGRQLLRPRTTHRRTSNAAAKADVGPPPMAFGVHAPAKPASVVVREAVAEELVQVVKDARKASVGTQDYMEEATKIMQLIRAKGKPKNSLAHVEEPVEGSELNATAAHDPKTDEDSSGDEFSRPPSRNRGRDLREQRRQQNHDPRIASHLQKFKESDDLDLLIETSALEPICVPHHAQVEEAARVPIPEDEQQSSPPNMRIRGNLDRQHERNHSTSTVEDFKVIQPHVSSMNSSSGNSTQRTVPTSSTSSSGRKGVINPGKVQIPDQVGAMTFDHTKKTWVKERTVTNSTATNRRTQQTNSEEDPFEQISDLSTEELRETERNSESPRSDISRPANRGPFSSNDHAGSANMDSRVLETYVEGIQSMARSQTTARSQLIEHENRIHSGQVSQAPNEPDEVNKQPRVVTIAFSSPLVSAVGYQDDPSTSELEASVTNHVSAGSRSRDDTGTGEPATNRGPTQGAAATQPAGSNSSVHKSWPGQKFVGRPVSRIEEQDEVAADEEMSLIPRSKSQAVTPVPRRSECSLAVPNTAGKASSILCLTPLSDFSLHQVDRPSHDEASFIESRRHPAALRQAHGSLALGLDDMMKAITDVEPFEPYWDHIRRLDLTGKHLTSLHRLEEYCAALEDLTISTNELRQLSGVPLSVRTLVVQRNHLSNMTHWGHLQNLQYLNISGNELESLEGLSCLHHLRELHANDNNISDIDGILDLDGLQFLTVQGNELESLDFEGGELMRLTRLDASRNQLAHVHGLSWLPALEDLNLEQNNLAEFAGSHTTPLLSLRHLRMSTNQLSSIDLSACPNIESLYLDKNKVTEVRCLGHARHLHTLSLREQTGTLDIIGHVLSTPNDCRKIFLSSNSVPGGTLRVPSKPLFSLRYLELSSCGISSVAAGFGARIPNCRVLNMNFNALACVSGLQGMFHLNKLLLAGNRLERLRRSCLALSRHPALTKVDLRHNPLTVGFYSPAPVESHLVVHDPSQPGLPSLQDPYVLPRQVQEVDHKWVKILDNGTRLRRRTIELLLAQKCVDLVELDGLAFDRETVLQPDELWEALTELGVLKRPMILPKRPISAQVELTVQSHVHIGRREGEECHDGMMKSA